MRATVEAQVDIAKQVAQAVEATREAIDREAAPTPTSTPDQTAASQQPPPQAPRVTASPTQQRPPQPTPDLARIALDRGIDLAEGEYYPEALKELERAQRLHRGRSEEAEVWLSKVQEALGNPEAALRHQQNAVALREGARQPQATPAPTAAPETKVVVVRMEPTPTPLPTTRSTPTSTPTPAPRVAPTMAPTPTILVIRPAPTMAPTRTPEPTPTILVIRPVAPTSTPQPIPVRAPAAGANSTLTRLTDLQNARWLSQTKPEIAEKMASLPWAADGLSETEEEIVEQLLFLYVANSTPTAVSLMDMPFLQSVNPGDLQAVTSLRMISQEDRPAFQQIMNHPTFAAGGITDAWTPVVATLKSAQQFNRNLIPTLLDHAQVHLETRKIQTPLRGTVALNIVRIGTASDPQSMDRLESAVRNAEAFMREPFPTDMVAILYADAVRGSNAGVNYGSGITILPEYDSATEKGAHKTIDHEVAHYYWAGDENWIEEGMATFIEAVFLGHRTGTRIQPDSRPCLEFRAIAQLSTKDDTHPCDYSLGERLFIDLHDAVGDQEFRKGMAALYRESTVEDNADNMIGTKLGISHVKATFGSAAAKRMIDRWYHGTEPYRTDLYDRDPVNPSLSVLNARVTGARLSINDAPVNSFSASSINSHVEFSIDYSHANPVGTPGEIVFQFAVFYQDGHPFLAHDRAVTASVGGTGFSGIGVYVWSPGQPRTATGEYVGYVYQAGNKVAQVHWTVTP